MFKEIENKLKFPKEIKEGFNVTYKMANENIRVYSSVGNEKWGLNPLHIVMTIEKQESGYDVILCLGKETYISYGTDDEIVEELNEEIFKYFSAISYKKNIPYEY